MTKLSNRFLELQLQLSSLLHAPVSMWIKQRLIFLRPKISNHLFGCAISTISFLYGRMDQQNFQPNLKFTYESSQKKVAFLDHNVSFENGCITTDLHNKSTDCHQYLHCSSAHPDHLKNSIIYNQALRLSNICTYERDLIERGYFQRGDTQRK